MGYFIFALILLIIAGILYIINDNREQRLFEEYTGQTKASEHEPKNKQPEPEKTYEPKKPQIKYEMPHSYIAAERAI